MDAYNYLRIVVDCMVPGCGWSKIAFSFNAASGLWESHESEKHPNDEET